MASITIQNPTVNSGTALTINGVSFSYTWKVLNNVKPVPGKYATVEADVSGFENPMLNISGVIDIAQDQTTDRLLKLFGRVKFDGTSATATKLTISLGVDVTHYIQDYDGSNDFLYVIIDNIVFNVSQAEAKEGERLNFTMTLKETPIR